VEFGGERITGSGASRVTPARPTDAGEERHAGVGATRTGW
jgi:hypothetical protein